jgi:NAD(P)-dependent dehydrogenase (short-subunit alcohol dehydrogenase family)
VTGAASGIGAAVALRLCSDGTRVVSVDRADCDAVPGGLAVQADVSLDGDCARTVAAAVDRFGRVDVLVNSAGIQRYGDVVDTTPADWDEVIAVNLRSAYLMSHHAIPHLAATGSGAVVHVSSVQALAAQRGVAAYAASKGALVALTHAMAVDHAPAVRVNAVLPGSVDTAMLRASARTFADDEDQALTDWGAMHPLGRVARAEEVAEVVAFLCSPRASFVTGSIVRADGGLMSRIPGT